ncbi:MAG: hypothetical protein R3E11_06820 [Sphingobium sp.]|nr:hypothetical protein [Sphingobium sp.]MCP5398155.1 hypothetical protein [Sphingomonas sp.]
MKYVAVLAASIALLGAAPVSAKDVSFSADIVPVLKKRCAICHLTGQEAGHLALHPKAAFKNLVSHKSEESDWMLVQPKQPDKSYLVMKLEGTHLKSGGKGARMPFAQQPLDTETVALFRAWIKAGALNN